MGLSICFDKRFDIEKEKFFKEFVKMSDDRFDNRRYYNEDTFSIQSTAGAVPVKNKKGEVTMEKVKVNRYVSGKRPDYARGGARSSSESDSSDEDDFTKNRHGGRETHGRREAMEEDSEDEEAYLPIIKNEPSVSQVEDHNDPRLRRLRAAKSSVTEQRHPDSDQDDDQVLVRHRRIHEPEVLSEEDDEEEAVSEESDSDETTEEETTDSEQEEGARFKPVFVRKRDRLTVQEREREEAKQRQNEREAALLAEQRRRDTLRMVENTVKLEEEKKKSKEDPEGLLNTINTDDENEEVEYEAWKLRELKRLKRDRDEKEEREREQAEVERLRNMTEEERRLELKMNPKTITNKASKGKYKFLQKYYHRGAFFLDKEENVFTRDYTSATLEDKFDKTVLPKVMQVKNFGRSGRTKYTHLVDQDTTQFDAAWSQESAQNLKFQLNHAAGTKPVFERPSAKKKK